MTYDLSKEYNTDSKKESEGVWEPMGGDCKVLVAAWGNPKYQAAIDGQPRQIRRRIDRGKLSDTEDREIMVVVVGDTILLGWKNLLDDGKEIKYTKAMAAKILAKHPKFYRDIVAISNDESLYQKDDVAENLKNS